MIRVAELAETAGVAYMTAYRASRQGLIETHGDDGSGNQWYVAEAEAERVIHAARIARDYSIGLATVLRWQREGRIESADGDRLTLAPAS